MKTYHNQIRDVEIALITYGGSFSLEKSGFQCWPWKFSTLVSKTLFIKTHYFFLETFRSSLILAFWKCQIISSFPLSFWHRDLLTLWPWIARTHVLVLTAPELMWSSCLLSAVRTKCPPPHLPWLIGCCLRHCVMSVSTCSEEAQLLLM